MGSFFVANIILLVPRPRAPLLPKGRRRSLLQHRNRIDGGSGGASDDQRREREQERPALPLPAGGSQRIEIAIVEEMDPHIH